MNSEKLRKVYVSQGIKSYRRSDSERWNFALWASRVVGNYDRGATIGMAEDMSVSSDTVENHAHAYMLFEELCKYENGKYRYLVFVARRMPYVYISHFISLHKAKTTRNLDTKQILDILMDIVQAEGSISSRAVDGHVQTRYGDTRDWTYYANKALKEMKKTLGQPDLPTKARKQLENAYKKLYQNKGK